MTTQTLSQAETKLYHRQVEALTRYATGELEKAAMTFTGSDGRAYFSRISFGKLRSKARDILRTHPDTVRERFAEYVAGLVRAEAQSYDEARRAARRRGTPGNVAA